MLRVNCCSAPVSLLFVCDYYHCSWHGGRNLDEELIQPFLTVPHTCRLSGSPAFYQGPVGGAFPGPACICSTTRAPCLRRPLKVCVRSLQTITQLLGQLLDSWSSNCCGSLWLEGHQKVQRGGASHRFDCWVWARRDSRSRVNVGLRLLLVLFQKEMGERVGDRGTQRRVGMVGGWEWSRAAALGRVTGAARRSATAASWSQALRSTTSSIKIFQDGVAARSLGWQRNTKQNLKIKNRTLNVHKHENYFCFVLL